MDKVPASPQVLYRMQIGEEMNKWLEDEDPTPESGDNDGDQVPPLDGDDDGGDDERED